MTTKKYLMAFAAIAAVSLASCSSDEEISDMGNSSKETPVAFGTYLGNALESRSGVATTDTIKKTGIGVYGYYTAQKNFTSTADATAENPASKPNFMWNQKVEWKTNVWDYAPVKYWPNTTGDKLTFFAYAPYFDNAATNTPAYGITEVCNNETEGEPTLKFTLPEKNVHHVDLMYANPADENDPIMNLEKPGTNDKVTFKFKHALSRIGFKRQALIDGITPTKAITGELDEATTITINKLTVSLDGLSNSGTMNFANGKWTDLVARTEALEYIYEKTEDWFGTNNVLTHDDATDALQLLSNENYLMVIPNEPGKNTSITVTIDYTVDTEDANVAGGHVIYTNSITKNFNFEFKAGKAYNFLLKVGLTSVKFEALVSDWDEEKNDEVVDIPAN